MCRLTMYKTVAPDTYQGVSYEKSNENYGDGNVRRQYDCPYNFLHKR